MKYISTRGKAPALSFEDVVLTGVAKDGGLYVPETFPEFSPEDIASFKGLEYPELMLRVVLPYVGDAIPELDLKDIITRSYQRFSHPAIAPVTDIGKNRHLLELYHGPTLAFKDFALQFLGHVFDYLLEKRDEKVVVIGATSGDTGSAAIQGCFDCSRVQVFILHPEGKVSDVQRLQMTTVDAEHIHNLAVKSDFDECQAIVKTLFNDASYIAGKHRLVAVNSINWCRIMAQVVYYFYAACNLSQPEQGFSFSVPTGNFGDVFAGYVAKKMGLPINRLIVATNKNDILHRFFSNNAYERQALHTTLSPSMDIQVSSNFERLLFDLYENNGDKVSEFMHSFEHGNASVDPEVYNKARTMFASCRVDDEETVEAISYTYKRAKKVVDPHTATAVKAALDICVEGEPVIILSTAHPAKFPRAIERAGVPQPEMPQQIKGLFEKPEHFEVVNGDVSEVGKFIASTLC